MGKRTAYDAHAKGAHFDRDNKRQRTDSNYERNSPRPNGGAEEVTTARDLQNALFFDQSSQGDFRSGNYDFRPHLQAVAYLIRSELIQAFPRLHPLPDRRKRPAPQASYSPRVSGFTKGKRTGRQGQGIPAEPHPRMGSRRRNQLQRHCFPGHSGACAPVQGLCEPWRFSGVRYTLGQDAPPTIHRSPLRPKHFGCFQGGERDCACIAPAY